jgi:hypothetical protein
LPQQNGGRGVYGARHANTRRKVTASNPGSIASSKPDAKRKHTPDPAPTASTTANPGAWLGSGAPSRFRQYMNFQAGMPFSRQNCATLAPLIDHRSTTPRQWALRSSRVIYPISGHPPDHPARDTKKRTPPSPRKTDGSQTTLTQIKVVITGRFREIS